MQISPYLIYFIERTYTCHRIIDGSPQAKFLNYVLLVGGKRKPKYGSLITAGTNIIKLGKQRICRSKGSVYRIYTCGSFERFYNIFSEHRRNASNILLVPVIRIYNGNIITLPLKKCILPFPTLLRPPFSFMKRRLLIVEG